MQSDRCLGVLCICAWPQVSGTSCLCAACAVPLSVRTARSPSSRLIQRAEILNLPPENLQAHGT